MPASSPAPLFWDWQLTFRLGAGACAVGPWAHLRSLVFYKLCSASALIILLRLELICWLCVLHTFTCIGSSPVLAVCTTHVYLCSELTRVSCVYYTRLPVFGGTI